MTIKEIYDDLMKGGVFVRRDSCLGCVYITTVEIDGKRSLVRNYSGRNTDNYLSAFDFSATDWERA